MGNSLVKKIVLNIFLCVAVAFIVVLVLYGLPNFYLQPTEVAIECEKLCKYRHNATAELEYETQLWSQFARRVLEKKGLSNTIANLEGLMNEAKKLRSQAVDESSILSNQIVGISCSFVLATLMQVATNQGKESILFTFSCFSIGLLLVLFTCAIALLSQATLSFLPALVLFFPFVMIPPTNSSSESKIEATFGEKLHVWVSNAAFLTASTLGLIYAIAVALSKLVGHELGEFFPQMCLDYTCVPEIYDEFCQTKNFAIVHCTTNPSIWVPASRLIPDFTTWVLTASWGAISFVHSRIFIALIMENESKPRYFRSNIPILVYIVAVAFVLVKVWLQIPYFPAYYYLGMFIAPLFGYFATRYAASNPPFELN